jgi:ABC-type Fe3+-hydroxamate transport system substrate-binding protein
MMMRLYTLPSMLAWIYGAAAQTTYPFTYTDCGIDVSVSAAPSRVVTMNQGVTEFMLAMGLQANMAGTAYLDDAIWPRYTTEYNAIPVLASGYVHVLARTRERRPVLSWSRDRPAWTGERVSDHGRER